MPIDPRTLATAVLRLLRHVATDGPVSLKSAVVCHCPVGRQTVREWLNKYADKGIAAIVDKGTKPGSCLHQSTSSGAVRLAQSSPGSQGG